MADMIMVMTEWRPVIGFDKYLVSDDGQVFSLRKNAVIYQHTLNHGHKQVRLFRGDRGNHGHPRLVHILMLEAFVSPCPPGMECLHENDVAADNRLGNLRWGTRTENVYDALRNGKHWSSKITHCPKGHEYTPENTYSRPSRKERSCRTCIRERWQKKAQGNQRYHAEGS